MDIDHSHASMLTQAVVLLTALALAGPAARAARTSAVLAYLLAGILIGPYGLGLVASGYDVQNILGLAEFGVVLLLFVIGLELRPKRLWAMRVAVFGTGTLQIVLTAIALMAVAMAAGLPAKSALFVGLALSLSSTALALQVLEEKGEVVSQHGRTAFAILLMQDLASLPMIALAPLFAVSTATGGAPPPGWAFAATAIAVIAAVIVIGRVALAPLYRFAAASGVKEATSAMALLTVASVALVMELAGLSPALGAFIAGALLAESEFRHDIEANIAPFEGLLLGLFFTVMGMSLNLRLMIEKPQAILVLVAGLIAIKALILYGLGRWRRLGDRGARRLALSTSQGGEFAFVLLAAGVMANVIDRQLSETIAVVVTLSMVVTPLVMALDDRLLKPVAPVTAYETPREEQGHVIIAGFGRFGQIVARVLTARGIPFIALDRSMEQVGFIRRFGSEVYFGDATRLDLITAARADKARAFVLAIDDVEASLRTAETVRRHYPDLPIFARARNRQHVYKLLDLGVKTTRRETFLSALDLTRLLLIGLGTSTGDAARQVETFKEHDRKRLYADYAHYTDIEKVAAKAKQAQRELEELFASDVPTDSGSERRDGSKPTGDRVDGKRRAGEQSPRSE